MLGSAISKQFDRNGSHEVLAWTRKTGDLRDPQVVGAGFRQFAPEVVIHCAAKVGGIQANIAEPFSFLVENLRIDENVRQAALDSGVRQMLYIGSSCMYPVNHRQPLCEMDVLSAPLEPTNEGYALAKIVGSRSMAYASQQFGVDFRTIIASNLYGPGDNFDPLTSHLVAAAIHKAHEAKQLGRPSIEIWGDGSARREFTFVTDFADWVCNSIDKVKSLPDMLNVGVGQDFSVLEYYEQIVNIVGYKGKLVFEADRPSGMRQKLMDSSLARRDFGWNPSTSLEEGLLETYKDYLGKL